MLPMIAVAGNRSTLRRYNKLWNRARASTEWWQNPTLSFGPGYPQWVPSSSVSVDVPPIQANSHRMRTRFLSGTQTVRTGCYKSGGGCKTGYRVAGYDAQGNAICCPGRTGPMIRNPSRVTVTPGSSRGGGIGHAGVCRELCKHHGVGIAFHQCYQNCMGPTRSATPSTLRRLSRMHVSAKRRMEARAIARAARSMVTVGKKACCESCAHGGPCKGGCGDNCNCGKEGRHPNPHIDFSPTPTMRMMPARVHNARTIQVGDMVFATPTTSRLANATLRRRARLMRGRPTFTIGTSRPVGSVCNKNADCGHFMKCVNGRCVESRPR